jgi:hypothetical protein
VSAVCGCIAQGLRVRVVFQADLNADQKCLHINLFEHHAEVTRIQIAVWMLGLWLMLQA